MICNPQQTVYSSNTYVYSLATTILGLWAGILECPSSQAPRPDLKLESFYQLLKTALFAADWFIG